MLSDQEGKLIGLGDPAVRADAPNQSAEWAAKLTSKRTVSFRSTVDRRSLAVEHKNLACVSVDGNAGLARPLRAPVRGQLPLLPRGHPRRQRQAVQGHQPRRHRLRLRRPPPPHHRQPARRRRGCLRRSVRPLGIAEALGHDADFHGADGSRRRHRQPAAKRAPVRHPRHPRLADLRRLADARHEHPPAGLLGVARAGVEGGGEAGGGPDGRGPADL